MSTPYYDRNQSILYSPITLNQEWNPLARLLVVMSLTIVGTIVNGFLVAAFSVEKSLKKSGYAFLACAGLCDMLQSSVVMLTSTIVILSDGEWDSLYLCHSLQLITTTAVYAYNLFYVLVTIETYFRLCQPYSSCRLTFTPMSVGFLIVIVFVISFVTAAIGVFNSYDYDYCQRKHFGNIIFLCFTSVVFHIIPCILVVFGLFAAAVCLRSHARERIIYRRSLQFARDSDITSLNLFSYVIFLLAWTPCFIIVHYYPSTSDSKLYHSVWIGISRTAVSNYLYSAFNQTFRNSFKRSFYYCYCKSPFSHSPTRRRRELEYRLTTGDIQVHILRQTMTAGAGPLRNVSSRETVTNL